MRKWTWLAIAAIAALGVAELGARHEGFGKPLLYRSAASGYEMAPDQRIVRLSKSMSINAIGTRGADLSPFPAKGTWRIMVLGDSVANGGSQLTDAQTFPAVASQALNAQGCHAEILNASAGGWSLFDEVAWVHAHGLSGATMVVWTINSLDLDQPASTAAILDHNPSFPSHAPATALSEILFRYALPRVGLGASAADNGSVSGAQFDARQFAAVRLLVTTMKHQMDGQHTPMIVLFHDTLVAQPAARNAAKAQLLAELDDEGIPVVQTGLSQQPDAAKLFIDTIHPNARGDALIGAMLAKSLQPRCPTPPPVGASNRSSTTASANAS